MPMQWVAPEKVLKHKGVTVYRAYKDANASRPLTYHYTTSETDEDDWAFDVRCLEVDSPLDPNDPENHKALIRLGIEAGRICNGNDC